MPRQPDGEFIRLRNWVADRNTGLPFTPERLDTDADDMADAISETPTREEMQAALDAKLAVVDLGATLGSSSIAITNSAGTGATLPAATSSVAGLLTATDKQKLDAAPTGSAFSALSSTVTEHTSEIAANAAAIASLTSTPAAGIFSTPVVIKLNPYDIQTTDRGKLIAFNATAADLTATLPSAVAAGNGWTVGIRHSGTAHTVVIRTASPDTMSLPASNAATAVTLTGLGHTLWFVSDGTGWHVDSETPPIFVNGLPYFRVVSTLAAPASDPIPGSRYIASALNGAWASGHIGDVWEYDGNGGWLSYRPANGWLAFDNASGVLKLFASSAWVDTANDPISLDRLSGQAAFELSLATQISSIGGSSGALSEDIFALANRSGEEALRTLIKAHEVDLQAKATDLQSRVTTIIAQSTETLAAATSIQAQATATSLANEIGLRDTQYTSVQSSLSSLTTSVGNANSAITAEQTARASADAALTTSISGLTATVATNTSNITAAQAAITSEAATRASADSSLSASLTTLTSTVNQHGTDIAAAQAAIASESTARASADTAISSSLTSLTSTVNGNTTAITAANAAIATEQTTRAAADASMATSIGTLQSTVTQHGTDITAANAAIASEATTRASADAALTTSISNLSSTVTEQGASITAAQAAISSEATTRASADTALTNSINSLTSTVNQHGTDITAANAAIASEATTRANADSALTSSINTLTSTVNSQGTAITAAQSAITTEQTTRASADTSLANSITTLSSTVSGHGSDITALQSSTASESSTRASADTALGSRIDAVRSTVTGVLTKDPTLAAYAEYWVQSSGVPTISAGSASDRNKARAIDQVVIYERTLVPIDSTKTYFVRGRFQRSSDATRNAILFVRLVDSSGANIAGDGTYWFNAWSGQPGTTWSEQSATFGAGTAKTFPGTATAMTVGVILMQTSGSAVGWHDAELMRIEDYTSTAAIASEASTRASADAALTSSLTSLTSTVNANTAAIASESSTRASADTALSSSITSLTSTVNSNTSAITSEATTRANADTALTNSINSLTSTVNSNTAAITSEASTRATADTAISSSVTSLTTTVNGHTASISSQASSISGLQAKYVLTVNGSGHVAGIELASGSGGSTFVILADKFLVLRPDQTGTAKQVFVAGLVNGASAVGIDGNLLVDGTILARSIAANTITADRLNVASLSSIAANIGTVTAGLLKSADNKMQIDLTNKLITMDV